MNIKKKASIETDMAQRIMLSLLPEVMDPLQKSNTLIDQKMWGLDIVALRSAVRGAKALIINGAKACVGELRHYTERASEQGLDTKDREEVIIEARNAIAGKSWAKALVICKKAFLDEKNWNRKFGGQAWANIAEILLKINATYLEAQMARSAGKWDEEVEAMKECIIQMNVFDGIAHNTGSVMPKVLEEEQGHNSGDEDALQPSDLLEYKSRVEKMMDAKELRNPLEVYKQIEPIIESSPYKNLFKDWIHKLRQHPNYRQTQDPKDKLNKIRAKKLLINKIQRVQKDSVSLKEALKVAIEPRERTIYQRREELHSFREKAFEIESMTLRIVAVLKDTGISSTESLERIRINMEGIYVNVVRFYNDWYMDIYKPRYTNAHDPAAEHEKESEFKEIERDLNSFYLEISRQVSAFMAELNKLFEE